MGFAQVGALDLGTGPHLDTARAANTPDAEATVIRGLLARFNLTLTDLYIMLPQINAPEPDQRETALELFEELVPFALALGSRSASIRSSAHSWSVQVRCFLGASSTACK